MQSNLDSNLKKISEKEKLIQTLESWYKTCSAPIEYVLLELETLKATCETQKTKIVKLESELSQVEGQLVVTERVYSDAERRFMETTGQDHIDFESLQKNFEATSATLREKLAKIDELEETFAALFVENSRLAQQNISDAGALEDLRAKSVSLDLELEQKDTRISDLTGLLQSFENLDKEKSQLEGKLTEATKLYVGLESDKNKIIKETSAGLNSALLESQQNEITISDLKIEIGDWKTKFGDLEEKSRNLKKDLSDMTSNFDQMHVESQDKDRLFSEMQSNLKNISEKMIQTLESDNKTLTSQLDAALLGLETIKATAQT
jgi:chromosome segregation ATPase